MSLGDALTLLGIALAVLLWELQRLVDERWEIDAAGALIVAVRQGLAPWGDLYFGAGYDAAAAEARGAEDFRLVMDRNYAQVFHVPTEPLEALIANPAAGGRITEATVTVANVALWQLGVFNQLVGQQTDFNAQHIAEMRDPTLPPPRREALATAASSISTMLHRHGISDALWYSALLRQLETNRLDLVRWRRRSWWSRPTLVAAALFSVVAVVASLWTGVDRVTNGDLPAPRQLPAPASTTPATTTR
jgi:hypothetical protein